MNTNKTRSLVLLAALSAGATNIASAQDAPSEETIAFFEQNCMSCHTIGGGRLTGPDLKGATERADADWLASFIIDPKRVIDSGDAYAAELLREARGVVMTKVPGIDKTLASKLVRLIETESAKEESRFAGVQISDRPLTDADIERGERLFRGAEALEAGGPSCIACHTVSGLGGLGGGRLGPDLTSAYARLEGRTALAAWLSSPPSLAMQPLFRGRALDGEEVLALVAYLKDAAESGAGEAPAQTLEFLLSGFAGAIFLLLLFDFLWRKRYRATRRPLTTLRRHRAAQRSPQGSSMGAQS